ncbi:hypothetical protein IAD21_05856 [Abditibacteriota bacterium]|nr:hypothetical protein IAD21_05856 [Abditibacteriota bacterium]
MNSLPLFDPKESDWDEAGRATLRDFIHMVANTSLKIKVLSIFLYDPYLCLSSEYVAHQLGDNASDVQRSARELHAAGAFHYCETFGYADLCSLSFQRHTPAIQHCLCLLRLALRLEPEFVWAEVGDSDSLPHDMPLH